MKLKAHVIEINSDGRVLLDVSSQAYSKLYCLHVGECELEQEEALLPSKEVVRRGRD